jgi:hypothetical protein
LGPAEVILDESTQGRIWRGRLSCAKIKSMSKVFLGFIFVSLFLVANSFASDEIPAAIDGPDKAVCENIDLNKADDSPLRKIPTYNQSGTKICYAESAATMVDYYRLQHGAKETDLTDPVYAAWLTNSKKYIVHSLLDGGYDQDTITALKKYGACENSEIQSRLKEMQTVGGFRSQEELLFFLEVMYKNYHGIRASKNWDQSVEELSKYDINDCDKLDALKSMLIKENYFAIAPTAILQNLFKDCKPHPIQVPDVVTLKSGTNEKFLKVMTTALQSNQPAGANICQNFFDNDYVGAKKSLFYRTKKDCIPHAVLVTGQASIGGKCQYLIRNSSIKKWIAPTSTACACITTNGKYKDICKADEIEETLGCWFPQTTVVNNMNSATTFKTK